MMLRSAHESVPVWRRPYNLRAPSSTKLVARLQQLRLLLAAVPMVRYLLAYPLSAARFALPRGLPPLIHGPLAF